MDAPIPPHGKPTIPSSPPHESRDRAYSPRLSHDRPYTNPRKPDPFDALADLFLGPVAHADRPIEATSPPPLRLAQSADPIGREIEPKPESPAHAAPRSSPRAAARSTSYIEGIVLGHLPVFASAWATQYAKQSSLLHDEPVALLRFTGGRASLDIYGSSAQRPRHDDLAAGIADAASVVSRWIIRLPDACEPELAEGGADAVTLLTGADEAAIVACYRTLKSLSSAERARDAQPFSWRVAIMGADPVKADEAAQRVERAASAFLENELEIAPCVARIGALRSMLCFDGPTDLSWRDAIGLIRSSPSPSEPGPGPRPPAPAPTTRARPTQPDAAPRVEMRPIVSDPEGIAPRQLTPQTAAQGQAPRIGRAEPQRSDRQRAEPQQSEPPGWLPGLLHSKICCPHAPGVEFASDSTGEVHLIVRDGAEQSVKALVTAAAWANDHAALIRMADPAIRSCSKPVLHVLTTSPASERRLLDTPIRVHALVRAGDAWAVLDLN